MKAWLAELGVPVENVRVIPNGIDIVARIGDKALAKQYTAPFLTNRCSLRDRLLG